MFLFSSYEVIVMTHKQRIYEHVFSVPERKLFAKVYIYIYFFFHVWHLMKLQSDKYWRMKYNMNWIILVQYTQTYKVCVLQESGASVYNVLMNNSKEGINIFWCIHLNLSVYIAFFNSSIFDSQTIFRFPL